MAEQSYYLIDFYYMTKDDIYDVLDAAEVGSKVYGIYSKFSNMEARIEKKSGYKHNYFAPIGNPSDWAYEDTWWEINGREEYYLGTIIWELCNDGNECYMDEPIEDIDDFMASRKMADRYDQFFNGCYVADLKHWGNSIDDVEFEISAYAHDYTYEVNVWGTGLSNEGYGNSSWEVSDEYGEDIRAVAEKALDGLEFYHVTRDDVVNQIVMLAPEIAEQSLELDDQTRERIMSDMVEYAIENEMDLSDQDQYYSRAYNTDLDDAKYYLSRLLDSYGFADVGNKDYVIESIIEDVAWDMIDGRRANRHVSTKNATRHFTYAEMQELDDEIEGKELHNATRLRYTTGTELM